LVQFDVVPVLGCSHSVDVDCGADLFWSMLPGLQGEVATYFAHFCRRIGERMSSHIWSTHGCQHPRTETPSKPPWRLKPV